MVDYTLLVDGDSFEQKYWSLFIESRFSNYEIFWNRFIIPLTNRPKDIHFKTDIELNKIGKTHQDICIAQLNYSVLRHLIRVYDLVKLLENNNPIALSTTSMPTSGASVALLGSSVFSTLRLTKSDTLRQQHVEDILTEGMVRICGAQDVAFELLERFRDKKKYEPWLEAGNKKKNRFGGKEARETWIGSQGKPLQHIRNYRNHLVHGRLSPRLDSYFPKIGKQNDYLDWRRITQLNSSQSQS